MASKTKNVFVCSECGYKSAKWYGQCPNCGEWNTMEETVENASSSTGKVKSSNLNRSKVVNINDIAAETEHRYKTGMNELDRALGGGIVKGSLVLLSGDPGIGKSTLLLQICESLGKEHSILYVSGEESAHQIKLRANRLGVYSDNLYILCETDAEYICEYIATEKPDIVMIDSIQTMVISELNSAPGSIVQVRECTNLYMRTAKSLNIPTILVGHVNKDGNIAGPKVLEHIVDTVLYFEGERNLSYRILRAAKNRFGSTNEIGVFEMLEKGLAEVENPSMMLISGRPENTSGSCIACVMEGSRPILAEVQGLVAPTGFGNPRRMANGFDYNRMAMLLAVVEKRAGYFVGNMDCYVNIIGGLKIDEPASDLSVALSVISSLKDTVIRNDVIAFGEIGLGGEIRSVTCAEQRVNEAKRLGFKRCVIPYHNLKKLSPGSKKGIEVIGVNNIRQAFEAVTE
ncbi:MAG: DNA repair protein RadA [Ruminococcaceae bacterium]|nr:DNA repair protein RadA [Oscillospiraceae bacterium]